MARQARFGRLDTGMLVASAIFGTAIWLVLPIVTGRAEAWDAPLYWIMVGGGSFVLGLLVPVRAWRWGMALVAGQIGAVLAQSLEQPGNLFPVGLALMIVLGALCAFLSWLGGVTRAAIGRE
jgi:hypothetical protein